jgi:hypothetical protein
VEEGDGIRTLTCAVSTESLLQQGQDPQLDRQIQDRIQAFPTEFSGLVRQSALEAVSRSRWVAAPARRGPGRPRKNAAVGPIAGAASASAAGGKSSASAAPAGQPAHKGKRAKRTFADVDATAAALLAYVAANEGRSIEQIGKGMGVATKELKLPVIKLMEANKVKAKGQQRATKDFMK